MHTHTATGKRWLFRHFTLLFIFHSSIVFSQNCNLPSSLPTIPAELEAANYDIAFCFAPNIFHWTENNNHPNQSQNGLGDLMTDIYYDGDFDITNNWESLRDATVEDMLPTVYYSVVWTDVAWIVTYAFYHPRDWTSTNGFCCSDNHEHDLEGSIFVVERHNNSIIHTLSLNHFDLIRKPVNGNATVFVDNSTHAVDVNLSGSDCIEKLLLGLDCENCFAATEPGVWYSKSNSGVSNINVQNTVFNDPEEGDVTCWTGTGEYVLEDVFTSDPKGMYNNKQSLFDGNKFKSSGSSNCQQGDASAPWGWDQFRYFSWEIVEAIQEAFNNYSLAVTILHNPYSRCLDDINLVVTGGTVLNWWYNNLSFVEITVKAGATLFIQDADLKFSSTGNGIVLEPGAELVMSNSSLNSCHGMWAGISNNRDLDPLNPQPIEINIFESAILNAENGVRIRTNSGSRLNPHIVDLDNVTFENCSDGVELINYNVGETTGRSTTLTVDDCTFTNIGSAGVKLVNNPTAEIHRSIFNGSGSNAYGVRATNSNLIFTDGNYVQGCLNGIRAIGMFPFATNGIQIGSSSTQKNTFVNNDYAVRSHGSVDALPLLIENNSFDGDLGLVLAGNNSYIVKNNEFLSYNTGLTSYSTGNEFNRISCNTYAGPNVEPFTFNSSNLFFGDNSRTDFVNNEFSGPMANVLLFAEILPNVGIPTESANNCFFDSDIVSLNSPSFTYWYKEHNDDPIDCKQEPQPNAYINIEEAQEKRDYCDGSIGVFEDIIGDPNDSLYTKYNEPIGDPVICWECIKDSVATWIDIVTAIGGDDPRTYTKEGITDSGVSWDVQLAQKKMSQWINYGLYSAKRHDTLAFAEELLTPLLTWDYQSKLFGIKLLQGDLMEASTFISMMEPLTQEEFDFQFIQQVQLKYLGGYFEDVSISKGELDTLRNIAMSETVMSGYARGLYEYLEGEQLPFILPYTTQERSINGFMAQESKTSYFSIYPNPAVNSISIDCLIPKGTCSGTLSIFSLDGRLVQSSQLIETGTSHVDVSELVSGVYVVRIVSDKGYIETIKVIKQ